MTAAASHYLWAPHEETAPALGGARQMAAGGREVTPSSCRSTDGPINLSSHADGTIVSEACRRLAGGRKEAEAANDLISDSEPLYLYWVKDPDAVQAGMFTKGTTSALLYSALFLLFNAAFVLLWQQVVRATRAKPRDRKSVV